MMIRTLFLLASLFVGSASAATVAYSPSLLGGLYWLWAWTPLTTTNVDGQALLATDDSGDTTVQVSGTFGAGGTVVIQGSIDGSTWATLNTLAGTAASLTAAGIVNLAETPPYIRPYVTAGDGTTSLTVRISKRRNRMN